MRDPTQEELDGLQAALLGPLTEEELPHRGLIAVRQPTVVEAARSLAESGLQGKIDLSEWHSLLVEDYYDIERHLRAGLRSGTVYF